MVQFISIHILFSSMAQTLGFVLFFPLSPTVPRSQLVLRFCLNICLGRHELLFVEI